MNTQEIRNANQVVLAEGFEPNKDEHPVMIVRLMTVNTDKVDEEGNPLELYRLEVAQRKTSESSTSKRLGTIMSPNRPNRAWPGADVNYINYLNDEIRKETGNDDFDLFDFLDQKEEITGVKMPESENATIIVVEFTEGEEVPKGLISPVMMSPKEDVDSNNKFKVRTWIDKEGNPKSASPKRMGENGIVLTKNGKNIYRNTYLWVDGDPSEIRGSKVIKADNQTEENATVTEAKKSIGSSIKGKRVALTNED